MIKGKLILIFSLLTLCLNIHAQNQDTTIHKPTPSYYQKDFSLLVGFNQGKYSFADIGLMINLYGANRHPFSFNYFISNEIKLGRDLVMGPKIGVWVSGGFAMGLNLIYFTDFDKGSLVFRPEFGIGLDKFKVAYGYNWHWTRQLKGLNKHQFGLTYGLKLKRLATISQIRI